jgi:hypothetical protein
VFKGHRLLHHSTLGLRVTQKKKADQHSPDSVQTMSQGKHHPLSVSIQRESVCDRARAREKENERERERDGTCRGCPPQRLGN